MTFTELLDAVVENPKAVTIPAQWGQGRASFGGLVAALLYQAMRQQVGADRPVRSLAITFVGPVEPEVAASYDVQVLREGKAVSQLLGQVRQNGQVMALMQGSFGAARESAVSLRLPAQDSGVASLEQSRELPFVAGVMPEFLRFMDMRWGLGGLPFSGTPSPAIGGYVRLRDAPSQVIDEAFVLALMDAWPPALLTHLARPAPGSSLTWTIEFIQPQPAVQASDWCRYKAVIEHAADGYGHTAAMLWGPQEELIAISRQTVTVFG